MSKVACKATKYEQQEVGANCKGVPGNNFSTNRAGREWKDITHKLPLPL